MCPICLANLILATVGAAGTGGLAAFAATRLRLWAAIKRTFTHDSTH